MTLSLVVHLDALVSHRQDTSGTSKTCNESCSGFCDDRQSEFTQGLIKNEQEMLLFWSQLQMWCDGSIRGQSKHLAGGVVTNLRGVSVPFVASQNSSLTGQRHTLLLKTFIK